MSLWGRLLVILVSINLVVFGVAEAATLSVQRNAQNLEQEEYQTVLQSLYQPVLSAVYRPEDAVGTETVRRILDTGSFRHLFQDVLITQGKPFSYGAVDLNPMGTSHRDHGAFPLNSIRDGIRQCMASRRTVGVAGGLCIPLSQGDRVAAGAWVKLKRLRLYRTPLWLVITPIVGSMLVFALLAGWMISRTVGRPLQALVDAGCRLGAGDYRVRAPQVSGSELQLLRETFNTMADKVEGHKEELEREVMRATQEAKRKERALVQSSRLASMGTLAAGIAHEINNPIGGMLNAVHRLAQKEDLEPRDRTYLELVREGLERVAMTARRMLDFSPRRDIQAVQVDVAAALQQASGLVQHRLQRQNVDLQVDIAADLPPLWGDPHEIQQVLLNLLLNSLNAMQRTDGSGWIQVRAAVVAETMRLTVEDNGPGVDAATLAQVLDPFFSGSDNPQSTGLGLFICYSIVQNHGGELRVRSEPGAGFRVEIELPVGPDRGAAPRNSV